MDLSQRCVGHVVFDCLKGTSFCTQELVSVPGCVHTLQLITLMLRDGRFIKTARTLTPKKHASTQGVSAQAYVQNFTHVTRTAEKKSFFFSERIGIYVEIHPDNRQRRLPDRQINFFYVLHQ